MPEFEVIGDDDCECEDCECDDCECEGCKDMRDYVASGGREALRYVLEHWNREEISHENV